MSELTTSMPCEKESTQDFPLILTGAPRDRSYLIIVNGQPRKITTDCLMTLIDLILARAEKPLGYRRIDPKRQAYPLRQTIGKHVVQNDGSHYRLLFLARKVAIDPTLLQLPSNVLAPSIMDRLRAACVELRHTIAPDFLDNEQDRWNES